MLKKIELINFYIYFPSKRSSSIKTVNGQFSFPGGLWSGKDADGDFIPNICYHRKNIWSPGGEVSSSKLSCMKQNLVVLLIRVKLKLNFRCLIKLKLIKSLGVLSCTR